MFINQGVSNSQFDDLHTPGGCMHNLVPSYSYELDTNVIKANDIQTVIARPDLSSPGGPETRDGKIVAHVNERLEGFVRYLDFCIGLVVATVDEEFIPKTLEMYTTTFDAGDGKVRQISTYSTGFQPLVQHGNGLMRWLQEWINK